MILTHDLVRLTPAFAAGLERSGNPIDNMRFLRVTYARYFVADGQVAISIAGETSQALLLSPNYSQLFSHYVASAILAHGT
jgi:hypothetical protein